MHDNLPPNSGSLVPQRWSLQLQEVMDATAALPTDRRDALLWLDGYARHHNLSLLDISGKLLKPSGRDCYSKDTVYQVLTGREKSIDNFVASVLALRAQVEAPGILAPDEFPFVRTAVADTVWSYIDLARKWHKMGLIIGESQTGKSRAIREYMAAHPDADILYHQISIGGHKSKVVEQLCELRGVSNKYNTSARELRLANTVTPRTLIVADEIQQCASRAKAGGRMSSERVDTIEFYRWLRDTRKCAVLLVGTSEALDMLKGSGIGHESGGIFIQTLKRALDPYVLKNRPPARDLNAFARAVGLDPAQGEALQLQNETVIARGLEIWLTYLLAGAELAQQENRGVTWTDVLAGHTTFKSGEGK